MAKAKPKKAIGRPSLYTPKVVEAICARLSEGEPMAVICRDGGMPAYRTVKAWMDEDSDRGRSVLADIARAREEGFDAIALEALKIADDGENDTYESGDGKRATNFDHIQRSKLRVDTRLKLLAKWDPKRYGEGMTVRGDKDAPIGASPIIIIGGVDAAH
jgi:terminase small subunit-like protein